MKAILGVAAMTLFTGTAFAEISPDALELDQGQATILLETDSGTKIKAVVPKEEADKLNNVKPGEQVKLYNQELREPEEEDEDIEME